MKTRVREDLTGQKFGMLTFTRFSHMEHKSLSFWFALCDCGNERAFRAATVKAGKQFSCGCMTIIQKSVAQVRHGEYESQTYRRWVSMKTRCLNSNNGFFHRYGGRGVKIWPAWEQSFQNFLDDMGECKGLSLDRIDNDGHYEPLNCRWVTKDVQDNNRPDRRGIKGRVPIIMIDPRFKGDVS